MVSITIFDTLTFITNSKHHIQWVAKKVTPMKMYVTLFFVAICDKSVNKIMFMFYTYLCCCVDMRMKMNHRLGNFIYLKCFFNSWIPIILISIAQPILQKRLTLEFFKELYILLNMGYFLLCTNFSPNMA